jgi:hypothetical protein
MPAGALIIWLCRCRLAFVEGVPALPLQSRPVTPMYPLESLGHAHLLTLSELCSIITLIHSTNSNLAAPAYSSGLVVLFIPFTESRVLPLTARNARCNVLNKCIDSLPPPRTPPRSSSPRRPRAPWCHASATTLWLTASTPSHRSRTSCSRQSRCIRGSGGQGGVCSGAAVQCLIIKHWPKKVLVGHLCTAQQRCAQLPHWP